MKLTKEQLKNFVREVMTEEGEYQTFFKKALEKTGKSIPDMSDEEKKEFFNKIDSAWDGKGEKNEGNAFGAAVTAAKKAGEDEFEVGGKTFKVEESTDCGCGSTNESVNEDANPKFFPSGKKEWAKSATFFNADKVDILLITSKYKDVNDAYYIFKKDGRFIGSAASIKGGKPFGTKVNVKLSDVSNAKSIGDLKKMIGESVNEGIGTIALGVAGGLLLLKVLKFVLKKVVGAVGMNVKLPKEQLLEVVKKTMEAALTKISSSGVDIVDIITLQSYLKDEINAGRITTIKQIVQVVDTLSKKGKNESVNEGIDWDELILKAKPGSAIKIDGKFRIKDKYGNWRIVHSWKNRHEDNENDVLVNRDIAKIANNKNMKVRKSGSYHIIESVTEATSSMSKEIASMTGTRQPAVQQFIDKHNINALKLAMYLNKQGLRGRMDFTTALSDKPGNPIQKKMIKMFGESVNEAGEDVNKAMIPGDVKIKLQKALDVLNGKKLTYPQKLQVLGRVLDSMGIDKGELNKISQKLKTKLESVLKNKYSTNEGKSDGGKMAKTHVIYQMNVKLNDNATVPGFRVSVKKGSDAEKRAKDLAKKHFGNEFKSIVSMSKALNPEINNVSEVVTEGRAFINAARKAKQEGKTEFEFNGKTYPVTIKD